MDWPMRMIIESPNYTNYNVVETGFGDISDPIYKWHVPVSWSLEKFREVFEEFGRKGVIHERGLHPGVYMKYGFQDYINRQGNK